MEHCEVLIDKGALPLLVQLLSSPSHEVVEQAVWSIGNIAGDNVKLRDLVIESGALEPVANILDNASPDSTIVRNASWSLSNFCRNNPAPSYNKIRRAVPTLAKVLLEQKSADIILDICWAFSYISDGADERIQEIIQTGIVPKLYELFYHPKVGVVIPALRTVGNLVTGDDQSTEMLLSMGLLNQLRGLTTHGSKMVRKEACWTISNITAGTTDQIR